MEGWAGPEVAALLLGALAWELAGHAFRFPFLPPLSGVLKACGRLVAGGEPRRRP